VAVKLRTTAPRVAVVGIGFSIALAVAVATLRSVNAEPFERSAEVPGNVAFAVVFAVPAYSLSSASAVDPHSWSLPGFWTWDSPS